MIETSRRADPDTSAQARGATFPAHNPPPQPPAPEAELPRPFQVADYTNRQQWPAAKQHLLQERLLPEVFIDALHQKGILEANPQGQPVFTRYAMTQNLERGDTTGIHLEDSSAGQGHFWVQFGEGEPQRVLITSSPLDALSLAAMERREVPTLYMSVDQSGEIPSALVKKLLEQNAQVVVALNRAEEPMARQLQERLPEAIRRTPSQGYTWNQQLQHRRYQALYGQYTDNGQVTDIVGITRNAILDGQSKEELAKILAHHPSLAALGLQKAQEQLMDAFGEQEPKEPQIANLTPHQLWQQYSQKAKAHSPVAISLEVAQMALRDQLPEDQIRQILRTNPHLQRFEEKGRTDLVEQPLAKAKRMAALSNRPPFEANQPHQDRQDQME